MIRAPGVPGCVGSSKKLLGAALVGDGLFAGIVGPDGRLNARPALVAQQARVGSRVRAVIGHSAASREQQESDDGKRPAHGATYDKPQAGRKSGKYESSIPPVASKSRR